MKRHIFSLLCLCLLLTGCEQVHVPPADYDEPAAVVPTASPETETETETEAETTAATRPPKKTAATETTAAASGDDDDDDDETTETEPVKIEAWALSYAALLKAKDKTSGHQDAYYALIRLNADKIPELVLLDDIYMSVYYYPADKKQVQLLLEDGYKGAAAEDANLCFQPGTGKLASAFSTMGGGSGYNFFFYKDMDPLSAERYCFNNNEDKDGEMPYNDIWDKAEDFDIQNNGYHDVTLGDSWTAIGKDFEDIRKLKAVDAETLTVDWLHILDDVHETEELEEDTTEKK